MSKGFYGKCMHMTLVMDIFMLFNMMIISKASVVRDYAFCTCFFCIQIFEIY
jgi:hypothetical protein